MGTPPTPAWVLTAALIGLVTLIATVVLAFALGEVDTAGPTGDTGSSSSEH